MDKARLHTLAEEKMGLEAKMKQLEGEIRSLQSAETARENALAQQIRDFVRQVHKERV